MTLSPVPIDNEAADAAAGERPFSARAWAEIDRIYTAILDLPFNGELAAGTLSRERFVFYMIQDAHYLNAFGRALALAAARAPDNEAMIVLAGSARECIVVERALHEGFFKTFGVGPEEVRSTEPSPTCALYTNALLAMAATAPYEVAIAALLPCFWIYEEVGKHLLRVAAPENPYQAWIDTYADEEFAAGVRRMIRITDALASEVTASRQEEMLQAFVTASRYEWMFWNSAYRLEHWPI